MTKGVYDLKNLWRIAQYQETERLQRVNLEGPTGCLNKPLVFCCPLTLDFGPLEAYHTWLYWMPISLSGTRVPHYPIFRSFRLGVGFASGPFPRSRW